MPLNKKTAQVPWDFEIGDKYYQKDPWILKKGKEFVTIEKDINNKGNFYLQKDEERRLSLSALQTRMTYHQLVEFGYKLQKPKKKRSTIQNINQELI
tara:strand:- start:850 stop:1140 length:291 start_codon:yes stop_codon:yes gene_type:complete